MYIWSYLYMYIHIYVYDIWWTLIQTYCCLEQLSACLRWIWVLMKWRWQVRSLAAFFNGGWGVLVVVVGSTCRSWRHEFPKFKSDNKHHHHHDHRHQAPTTTTTTATTTTTSSSSSSSTTTTTTTTTTSIIIIIIIIIILGCSTGLWCFIATTWIRVVSDLPWKVLTWTSVPSCRSLKSMTRLEPWKWPRISNSFWDV